MAAFPFQNAMSVREETIAPSFSIQATRPKNRTEGKIYRYAKEADLIRIGVRHAKTSVSLQDPDGELPQEQHEKGQVSRHRRHCIRWKNQLPKNWRFE